MTRQAGALGGASALLGGSLLLYLVLRIPPQMPDGQPNVAALLLALFCLLFAAAGIGTRPRWGCTTAGLRWQAYGVEAGPRLRSPCAEAPACPGCRRHRAAGYAHLLGAAYLIVTFVILVLFEAFIQSRA